MLGYIPTDRKPENLWTIQKDDEELQGVPVPVSIDWRERHTVTPVKDQGQCGSCWTFATVAVLEGAHARNTGQLLSFSEQLFVNCVVNITDYGYNSMGDLPDCCYGCSGGDYDASFAWAGNNSIYLVLEADMRYTMNNGTCNYESSGKTRVQVESYTDIPANTPAYMKIALSHQPIGVGIDAAQMPFQTYHGGIMTSTDCYVSQDHAVTAVGYGVSPSGMEFWIVKNSWGNSWGENGYIRIQNTGNNDAGICGINMSTSFATTITSD